MRKSENFLDYIPVYSGSCSSHTDESGNIVIDMPHKGIYNRIAQKVFKKPAVSHISLDKFGGFIYNSIDGKRSIFDISSLVNIEFGEEAEPLIERLVKYMTMLKNSGIIDLKKRPKPYK